MNLTELAKLREEAIAKGTYVDDDALLGEEAATEEKPEVKKDVKTKTIKPVKQPTKSGQIRELYTQGMSVSDIAKELGINYSFAYAVIRKLDSFHAATKTGPSKSEQIRQLADQGKKISEIAKELNANYSFVYSVVKKHKEQIELQTIVEEEEKAKEDVVQESKVVYSEDWKENDEESKEEK